MQNLYHIVQQMIPIFTNTSYDFYGGVIWALFKRGILYS